MNLRDAIPLDSPIRDATPDLEVWPASIPLRERLLDRMGDLLFCTEDLLDMIECDESPHHFAECERSLRTAYDTINSLMQKLSD